MDYEKLKLEITRRWDYSSQRYDGYPGHGVHSPEEVRAWQQLFQGMLPGKRLRILEVGCGTGEMSLILAAMGHEVHGLDLAPKMLARAAQKAACRTGGKDSPGILFHKGDAENPPFQDGFFDAIVARHVMWTLPNPQAAASNWARRLRPNGRLVVIDARWDDDRAVTRLKRMAGAWLIRIVEKNDLSKDSYPKALEKALPHGRGLPLEAARAYLERAGFKALRVQKLDDLIGIQKKHMPLRYRISYTYDYYAIGGRKPAGGQRL